MKTLLLAMALDLIAVWAQEPLSFQDSDILGKWYVSAVVSDTGPPVAQVSPILFSVLSNGDVRASSTYWINSQCRDMEVTLEKTNVPGEYRAFGGRSHLHVHDTPVRDYLVLYSEGLLKRRRFRVAKLIGRRPDRNLEALEAFKKFTQRRGLPQKDIHTPVQTEGCVPTASHT